RGKARGGVLVIRDRNEVVPRFDIRPIGGQDDIAPFPLRNGDFPQVPARREPISTCIRSRRLFKSDGHGWYPKQGLFFWQLSRLERRNERRVLSPPGTSPAARVPSFFRIRLSASGRVGAPPSTLRAITNTMRSRRHEPSTKATPAAPTAGH